QPRSGLEHHPVGQRVEPLPFNVVQIERHELHAETFDGASLRSRPKGGCPFDRFGRAAMASFSRRTAPRSTVHARASAPAAPATMANARRTGSGPGTNTRIDPAPAAVPA